MDDARARDEFERIELHQRIEKDRLIISHYEIGLADFRRRLEEWMYKLGRLDERLGDVR